MKPGVPILTVGLIGAAVAVNLVPEVGTELLQDRFAVREGQWWRLLTGHLVHHSGSHLFWNCFMIGLAGGLLEQRQRTAMILSLMTAGFLIGPGLQACLPDMNSYAGLSGIATALVTCVILLRLADGRCWRFALGLLILKLSAELLFTDSLFVSFSQPDVRSVPLAHVLGAVAGWLAAVLSGRRWTGRGCGPIDACVANR